MPPPNEQPVPASGPAVTGVIAEVPFTSQQGVPYRIQITNELDGTDNKATAEELVAAGPPGDDYAGKDRKAAKLSIPAAQPETFSDLKVVLDSLVPDATMEAKGIPTDESSDRVAEEQRNVRVSTFLYAFSREKDNDFHLILGRDPNLPPLFMNMEVSGLPTEPGSASLQTLTTVRNAFKTQFKDHLVNPGYNFIKPPMPVDIGGSLFFDATHAGGGPTPGPQSAKPNTVWEVHPVTTLTFEP